MSKILFISPEAFGYYKKIIAALELDGHDVHWLHQIPSQNAFVKAFIRLFPFFGSLLSNIYYNKVIKWNEDYDYVLIIKGEGLSNSIMLKMKDCFRSAEFVFYNWDSIENSKSVLKKLRFFDRSYSFDSEDCKNHRELTLLPLFYEEALESVKVKQREYEIFFAGTIHSNRFEIISNIVQALEIPTDRAYLFFFYQSRFLFYLLKLSNRSFFNIPAKFVSFKKKNLTELYEKMYNSNAIIDIANYKQNGLTMRCIEAIGAKRKLITNNKNIKFYSFYTASNIFILDDVNYIDISALRRFMAAPYECLSEDVYKELEIKSWVKILVPHAA